MKATKYNHRNILHGIGQGYSSAVCGAVSIDTSKASVTATYKAVKGCDNRVNRE